MDVATAAGRALRAQGVDHVFGVVGSGNFHVTNALVAAGARFVPAAHEGGAASMADGYARVSGRLAVLSVHQGPGVTHALTGLTEAAKSRTPLVVLAPEATNPRSNFFVDLPGLAAAVGAEFRRIGAERVAADVAGACRLATEGAGRTVVLALPLDVQAMAALDAEPPAAQRAPYQYSTRALGRLVDALDAAHRPVFIAGRGARRARAELAALADRCGALLAVSAAAKGLFAGDPWYLDVSGGFATPLCAELVAGADLVVAWGSTLNMWTTRHGRLIPPSAVVAQVDVDPAALGVHRPVDIAVPGDVAAVAARCEHELGNRGPRPAGWRTPELRDRIAAEGHWRDVFYVDDSDGDRVDPRTLTIALDDLLPAERTVAVDSGNFMGYPSMFLSVPDAAGFCFTQAFQSVGLGLASALGAAVARPDRLTVAALGDGGFLMSVAELTTAARLGLPLLVVVYDDAAYGAEVHHFGPHGHPLDTVRFPDTDLAAIARGFGCAGATIRSPGDLAAVRDWLAGPRDRPLVVDAKVTSHRGSWWLEEAFRGH
ncbi:thiamine pyrophosphate-binding protein [Micromonospora sp. CPCC 206061]|uniref:thiamine pyrophosphate-binding protein n=1 Tax=Micromonospora sp. CPCC 206061 TaxID=3122410 RepID=UPI002FF29F7B